MNTTPAWLLVACGVSTIDSSSSASRDRRTSCNLVPNQVSLLFRHSARHSALVPKSYLASARLNRPPHVDWSLADCRLPRWRLVYLHCATSHQPKVRPAHMAGPHGTTASEAHVLSHTNSMPADFNFIPYQICAEPYFRSFMTQSAFT